MTGAPGTWRRLFNGPKEVCQRSGARVDGSLQRLGLPVGYGHRDDAPARYHSAVPDMASLVPDTPPSRVKPTSFSGADGIFLYNRSSSFCNPFAPATLLL